MRLNMTTTIRAGMVVIAAAAAAACGGGAAESARETETQTPVAVTVDRVSLTTMADVHEAGGVLVSKQTAILSARVMAPILRITVQPGDTVRRGQTLVELESDDATAQVARADASLAAARASARAVESDRDAAQAALALATATHARIARLQQERSATTQELDAATAALRQAESRVAAAVAQVEAATRGVEAAEAAGRVSAIARGWTTVTAPMDGLVVARHADPGSIAAPGQPLLTIEAPGALQMEVRMDASRAAGLSLGQSAEVRVETGGVSNWVPATIAEIARVDPMSHSFVVTLNVASDASWRSGFFGRARFSTGSTERLTVPVAALVQRGQLSYVYQVGADGHARLRVVSLGRTGADRVEILSGLNDGDRVVTNPPATLTDGAQVRS
ncbi:MAG: acriflavin resistance protein [Acidimicrobiia bacterium]